MHISANDCNAKVLDPKIYFNTERVSAGSVCVFDTKILFDSSCLLNSPILASIARPTSGRPLICSQRTDSGMKKQKATVKT